VGGTAAAVSCGFRAVRKFFPTHAAGASLDAAERALIVHPAGGDADELLIGAALNRIGNDRFHDGNGAFEVRPLFITGSLVHGGAERHSITLSNKLAERGHECHAAYVKNDPSQLARFQGATSITCLHASRYFDMDAVRRVAALM